MSEVGRRERKKQATAVAIELAALELVLDRGLDETTVEAISDRADVTSRTFFNYYASKEDALLGNVKSTDPSFDPSRFEGGSGSTFDRVSGAIRASLADVGPEKAARTLLRREAMGRYPQLAAHEQGRMTTFGAELLSVLERLLQEEDPEAGRRDIHVRAITINHVIGAAYHIAASLWGEDMTGQKSLAEHFDDALILIGDVTRPVTAS
jgi:AcrR family transcriptional regulator